MRYITRVNKNNVNINSSYEDVVREILQHHKFVLYLVCNALSHRQEAIRISRECASNFRTEYEKNTYIRRSRTESYLFRV